MSLISRTDSTPMMISAPIAIQIHSWKLPM